MPRYSDYVFVLWGEEFEEAVAAIFVTELREAGLRVKLVGLTPPYIRGAHGLVLVPDLTLDQALPLAARTICLVIPHTSPGLKRLKNDPRLRKFFEAASAHQTRFVIGAGNGAELGLGAPDRVMVYPEREDIVEFARTLAGSL